MTETSFIPGPETAHAYRDALGCFGTGVTVVTTRSDQGPLAMTVNSFTSVSLEPPLLLWCPAKASLRHDAFAMAQQYAVHIMAEDQQDIALRFARSGGDFTDIDWSPSDSGLPVLSGCLARFDCTSHACHDGGDHSILVGRVSHFTSRPGQGLIFKRGQYGGFLGLE
jgi:flavin reductase (DIM6/NTAB) family NADH-FMN oxidoreductase RutF